MLMKNFLRTPLKYSYYYATYIIIAVNLLMYAFTRLFPGTVQYLGLSVPGVLGSHFWFELVTYLFTHGSLMHVVLNMLCLFFFGVRVEKTVGSSEFLLLYFLCGIVGGAISLALYYFTGTYNSILIGASGAVYSVLLVYATLFPRSIISIWGIIPVPAPLLIIAYIVIEIVSQIFSTSNVAHFAHLIGFFVAWLYLVLRMGLNPISVWRNAWRR